jgi:hypothetical protein
LNTKIKTKQKQKNYQQQNKKINKYFVVVGGVVFVG